METLGLSWLGEIAKQGFGYVLFLTCLVALYFRDKEAKKDLADCRDVAHRNEVKMAVALELTAKALGETNEADRQRTETDKVNVQVFQALIKQIDISDDRAKERAAEILRALEKLGVKARG